MFNKLAKKTTAPIVTRGLNLLEIIISTKQRLEQPENCPSTTMCVDDFLRRMLPGRTVNVQFVGVRGLDEYGTKQNYC